MVAKRKDLRTRIFDLIILVFSWISIIAGIIYTAGPFPLAYNGLGDLFVFIFFGVIGTMGTFYLHTQEISFLAFLTSIPVGALITNILIVNNYRDIEEDRKANKITLAVLIGKTFTRWQYIILLIVCYFISIVLYLKFNYSLWIFLPYLTLPVTFTLVRMLYKFKGEELNKTLELTARLAALYGLLFSIGLIV